MKKEIFTKTWDELDNSEKRELQSAINELADMETPKYWVKRIGIIVVSLITLMMWGCPNYNVWQKTLSGEAQLKEAEWNRQITIKEAEATEAAAVSLARAEVARARGVAEANQIIALDLGGPEGYLRYLWIQTLDKEKNNTIYIPTEANIPILEASRLAAEREVIGNE